MFLAGDVSGFAQSRSVLLTILVLAGVAILVASARRRRRVLTALAGCSLAVILGVTLVPTGGWRHLGFESGALHSIVTNLQPHRRQLLGWLHNSDGPANVVLFAPAGLLFTLLTRRPVTTTVGLTLLSAAIETYQSTLTTRVGSFADIVSNGLGALIGAAVGGVALLIAMVVRRPAYAGTAGTAAARNVRR